MKPRIKIGSAVSPDGTVLELYERDGDHEILAGGQALMGSRMHHSEEELARLACSDLPPKPAVMIGGLGVGYTLRATLDLLPPDGRAIQVELMNEVVEWNRGPLAHHANHPLDDPRAEVVVDNVVEAILSHNGTLAAIMLDVDNGPSPVLEARNSRFYTNAGLKALLRALVPGGRVAIWSADEDSRFVGKMERGGFEASQHRTHARPGRKGTRYSIFVGRKPLHPLPKPPEKMRDERLQPDTRGRRGRGGSPLRGDKGPDKNAPRNGPRNQPRNQPRNGPGSGPQDGRSDGPRRKDRGR